MGTEQDMTANGNTVEQGRFPAEKADHAMGLELQIVELVEQQARAVVQHRDEDAALLEPEIAALRAELAATAEVAVPGW
jgi:protein-arginine kinase activator protein McsA